MRLDQLRLFLRAVEEGSISAAARKSHLAQPAFSAHIRALEESLGARLFERSTKGVTLTPAGERLHDGARSLLRHVEQVRAETVSEGRDIAGEVRLVLAASMAPLLAGQLYWGVREAHPGIKLVIRDLLRVESETLVTSRQVDFGLLPNVATWVGAASEPVIASAGNCRRASARMCRSASWRSFRWSSEDAETSFASIWKIPPPARVTASTSPSSRIRYRCFAAS